MRGANFATIANRKTAATELLKAKAEPKMMKKEKATKKDSDAPMVPIGAFFIFMEEFLNTFKLNFSGEKSVSAVGKAGGEKWKSMSETGPVVRTSGASSSSDSVIAERSEPMPTVVSLISVESKTYYLSQSFAEGKLNADELVKSTVGKISENEPSPFRSLRLTGSLLPTIFVNLLVVLLIAALPVGATEPVQSFASSCSNELGGFAPCLPYAYAAPNNHEDSPTWDCCQSFIALVDSGDDVCLCILVEDPTALGVVVNKTKVLSLSSLCLTVIPNDLKSTCGERAKLPPTFLIASENGTVEQYSSVETRKGSFLPAFFMLLVIGILRVLLVIIF